MDDVAPEEVSSGETKLEKFEGISSETAQKTYSFLEKVGLLALVPSPFEGAITAHTEWKDTYQAFTIACRLVQSAKEGIVLDAEVKVFRKAIHAAVNALPEGSFFRREIKNGNDYAGINRFVQLAKSEYHGSKYKPAGRSWRMRGDADPLVSFDDIYTVSGLSGFAQNGELQNLMRPVYAAAVTNELGLSMISIPLEPLMNEASKWLSKQTSEKAMAIDPAEFMQAVKKFTALSEEAGRTVKDLALRGQEAYRQSAARQV